MAGVNSPSPVLRFMDANGDPYAAAQLFTYEAGTTTKTATYTDAALSVANANPIILDSRGECVVYLPGGSFKYVLAPSTDTDPPTSAINTWDNISAVAPFAQPVSIQGTAGEDLSANEVVYLSQGDGSLTTGRWYLADADDAYSADEAAIIGIVPDAITTGNSGTVYVGGRVTGFAGLSVGSVYFVSATAGAVTSSAPAIKRAVGVADSATSLVMVLQAGGEEATFPATLPVASGENLTAVSLYEGHTVTTVGNVGVGEDTLWSHNMSAGELASNGDAIKFMVFGKTANNADTKDLQVRIDDTATDTSLLDVALTVSEDGDWMAGGLILRDSTTTGRACVGVQCGPSSSQTTFSAGNVETTFNCTWANAVELRITGEATTNDDIQIFGGSIVVVKV